MARLIKTIGSIAFHITTTGIITYYSWQFVLGIPLPTLSPLLKSIAAISMSLAIVVLEIIAVLWCFGMARKDKQKWSGQWQSVQANQRAIPPGYTRVSLSRTSYANYADYANTNTAQSPKSLLRSPFLLSIIGIMGIVVVSVPIGFIYQSQIGATNYFPAYGSPTLSDSLRQPGQWYESNRGEFSGGSCQFSGGTFHVRETKSRNVFPCSSTSTYSDFAFQVEMSVIQGDCGGLDVRSNTVDDTGYIFSVCQDGTYTFTNRSDIAPPRDLVSTQHSSLIHTGLNHSNVISIALQGNDITLYANGQGIANVQDASHKEGNIALLALSGDSPTEVIYANATLWQLS